MKTRNFLRIFALSILVLFTTHAFAQTSTMDDSVITTKIKAKIALNQTVAVFNVNVSTTNGVVTLAGNVDSDAQASELVELAQSTDGVHDVLASQLVVKESKNSISDTIITAKVKGMFIQEKLFGDKDISATGVSVETNNGVVSLTGTVNSKAQMDNAIKIAKSVKDVKSVEAKLEIKPLT